MIQPRNRTKHYPRPKSFSPPSPLRAGFFIFWLGDEEAAEPMRAGFFIFWLGDEEAAEPMRAGFFIFWLGDEEAAEP
ncbi:hypothetical protein [Limnospira platensis]